MVKTIMSGGGLNSNKVMQSRLNRKDHWEDIAGYAGLVVRELENGDER
jgi:hypothetical protein